MADYKFYKDADAVNNVGVIYKGKKWIPFDEGNLDYQEYLKWVSEGNTADSDLATWEAIRGKRDQLLKDSDWTMTTGATIDQAQWAAYREKLRDLPQKYSSHSDVVWPTPPSTKGPNTK